MTVTRRSALMTFLFGAGAGPSLMQSGGGLETLVDGPYPPVGGYASPYADTPKFDPFAKERRIRELTQTANGQFNEYELEQLARMEKIRRHHLHLQSLKSVSPCFRVIMEQRLEVKEAKETWMDQAKFALERLLSGKEDKYYDGPAQERSSGASTRLRG